MFKIIKRIFLYLFLFLFVGFVTWCMHIFSSGRDAAILAYHSIGEQVPDEENLNIRLDVFEKQMKFLSEHNYNVISFADYVEILKNKKTIPSKTVVLTFDDGYENIYRNVFPVLKKYNFPATVFVVADFIGRDMDFFGHVYRIVSLEQLKEMIGSGLVTVGSHGLEHLFLPNVANEAILRKEIFKSKQKLESVLGVPVDFFCYPVGGYNKHIEQLVHQAGYKAAVTTFPKKKGFAHRDIYALKRIKATKSRRNMFVFFVETSGYYMRMKETRG